MYSNLYNHAMSLGSGGGAGGGGVHSTLFGDLSHNEHLKLYDTSRSHRLGVFTCIAHLYGKVKPLSTMHLSRSYYYKALKTYKSYPGHRVDSS